MILSDGVSGFYNPSERDGLPKVQFEKFKKEITGALSAAGYKPCYFKEAGVTPNFHLGVFECRTITFGVVCNSIFPLIAFVKEPIEHVCVLEFIDIPELENMIGKYTGFEVLSEKQLVMDISSNELKMLNKAELSQVKYWKPQKIGEVIFNWWD